MPSGPLLPASLFRPSGRLPLPGAPQQHAVAAARLEELLLSRTRVSAAGLSHLSELKTVVGLELGGLELDRPGLDRAP